MLSYWLEKICTLKNLALIGSCLYEKTEIDLFIKNSQSAGVLYQYEKPLLLGKDLLHITDGKKLGDLIKKAYDLHTFFTYCTLFQGRIRISQINLSPTSMDRIRRDQDPQQ